MSERYLGIHRSRPGQRAGAVPRFRRPFDVGIGALLGALIAIGVPALASPTPDSSAKVASTGRACPPNSKSWACVTPSSSPTPSPSPTLSPSPSPTPSATPTPTVAPTTSTAPPTTPTAPSPSTSSPTPTPTPSPTGRACPAFPAMPDTACTGVPPGITLHACNGNVTASGTYDGCLFSGSVSVGASNVTITRSKVAGGRVAAGYGSQTGLVLVDVEIDGQGAVGDQSGIGDHNYTCVRCNVHHAGRGAAVGSNVTIRDSFFHDFVKVGDAHMSGIGSNGGQNNQIVHNTIDCQVDACSGALVLYGDFSPINSVLVERNLFATAGSYCTYAGSISGKTYPHGTNVRYLDNRFSVKYYPNCGIYGPVSGWEWNTGNQWSGNTWTDGRPATP